MKTPQELATELVVMFWGHDGGQGSLEKAIAAAIEQRDREREAGLAELHADVGNALVRDERTINDLRKENAALRQQLEEAGKKEKCPSCGSSDFMYYGPPACPSCGAPNCCQYCCLKEAKRILWERLEEARKKIASHKEELCEMHNQRREFAANHEIVLNGMNELLNRQAQQLARAAEVLGPFKDMAELFARMGWENIDDSHTAVSPLKLGQLRAAAALHAELVKGGGK